VFDIDEEKQLEEALQRASGNLQSNSGNHSDGDDRKSTGNGTAIPQ